MIINSCVNLKFHKKQGNKMHINPIKLCFSPFLNRNISREVKKMPDNNCYIILSTIYHDGISLIDILRYYRIILLSIPEELFLFEKSLHTNDQTSEDPFSEAIYLNGKIKGGNGVFAICRNTDLVIKLKPESRLFISTIQKPS